jgi:hypothetical protein
MMYGLLYKKECSTTCNIQQNVTLRTCHKIPPTPFPHTFHSQRYKIKVAFRMQSHIGWEKFTKGRLSREWAVLIPQVRPAHKYPISPWEMMIHPPGGDNAVCMEAYTFYTAVCYKSLTATYQCKIQIPSNKLLVNKIVNNN